MTAAEIERLLAEQPMTAADAARYCGVTTDRVVRWIQRGKDGRRLEGYHAGRSWMTSIEALARFLAASPRLRESTPPLSDTALARAQAEGRRRLAEARIKLRAGN